MNEKQVILELLNLIDQSTLSVQGQAVHRLHNFLAYAAEIAQEVPNDSPTDGVDAGVPSGDGESD